MEAFKKELYISKWGIVYVGLKKQWLYPNEIMNFCELGYIVCNKDRHVKLLLALEDSLFDFIEIIKQFVLDDGNYPIVSNEDSNNFDFDNIPKEYWSFWEIEFLLRIVNFEETKEQKLYKVAAIHSVFYYPTSWHNFLYYVLPNNNLPIGIDKLYQNLINYIEYKIEVYKHQT